jgi:hypothetical protein
LNGLLDSVPDNSTRFARILEGLVKVTNNFKDAEANAGQCREMLQPLMQKSANASAPTINAVGHATLIPDGFGLFGKQSENLLEPLLAN